MDIKEEPTEYESDKEEKITSPAWFDVPIEYPNVYVKQEIASNVSCNLEITPEHDTSTTNGVNIRALYKADDFITHNRYLDNSNNPNEPIQNDLGTKREQVESAFDVKKELNDAIDKKEARVNVERTFFFERNFICDQCFDHLPTANLLRQHKIYMHFIPSCSTIEQDSGVKLYSCNECNYTSAKVSHVRAHKVIHTGEKPFKCDLCEYTSTFASNLQAHKKGVHIALKPFKCHVCEYRCERSHDLQRHETIHNIGFTVKRYMCTFCDYKCNYPSALKRHEHGHTGEKTFECHQCEYKCRNSGDLKKHNMVHSGEKPFACSLCNFKCAQSTSLKRHKMMHTGEKPYKCSLCDCKYTQLVHLQRHDRLVHSQII